MWTTYKYEKKYKNFLYFKATKKISISRRFQSFYYILYNFVFLREIVNTPTAKTIPATITRYGIELPV